MSDYAKIYSARSKLDPIRQPRFGRELLSLYSLLLESGPETPYDKSPQVWRKLMSSDSFAVGARGVALEAQVFPYFHRFSRLSAVRTFTDWKLDRETPLRQALGELKLLQSIEGPWIPLSRVAEGHLTSERGFTWWSSSPLKSESIVCDLHRRGMPNDWIKSHALLLRIRTTATDRIAKALAPTALDGFGSVIFEARADASGPGPGSAISIEAPDHLCAGEDEFVIGPVPVGEIEFFPIFVGSHSKTHRVFETDLHRHLADYYSGGLE